MELRLLRRHPGEQLSKLHQDIRRLMALAHPTLTPSEREPVATDHYVDVLDDPEFALKVRERAPATLDESHCNWKRGRGMHVDSTTTKPNQLGLVL